MKSITPCRQGSLLVVSPHFHDGIFSCGELIAAFPGALVVTVFTGTPPDYKILTPWDQECGFSSAYEATRARRMEDGAALDVLGAAPLWLGFCENQYSASPTALQIATELDHIIFNAKPNVIAIPLGLLKPEHYLVYTACATVQSHHPQPLWVAYEEIPHRRIEGVLQQRLVEFQAHKIAATPAFINTDTDDTLAKYVERTQRTALKRQAIALCTSLSHVFSRHDYADIEGPERYWRLSVLGECDENL